MQALGRAARTAAHGLATAPREQKDKALLAAAARIRAREPEILAANARDMKAATGRGLTRRPARPPEARCQARGGDGRGAGDDSRPRRSGRRRARALDPPQRPRHRPRARAAGCHRHHLREQAQRDGGRGRPLPQGRQRRDPQRRLGILQLERHHPELPAGRPGRGGPAGGRDPDAADHRPCRRRHHADDERAYRRDRAARRPLADRAGAAREPCPGPGPPGRQLSSLPARQRRCRDGGADRRQRQDAPHRRLRRRRDSSL